MFSTPAPSCVEPTAFRISVYVISAIIFIIAVKCIFYSGNSIVQPSSSEETKLWRITGIPKDAQMNDIRKKLKFPPEASQSLTSARNRDETCVIGLSQGLPTFSNTIWKLDEDFIGLTPVYEGEAPTVE
jgi:hypothetical protein